MNVDDIAWLEQKRHDVARLAEKFDQRGHDAPRFLRIIDELMRNKSEEMLIRELGRTWDE